MVFEHEESGPARNNAGTFFDQFLENFCFGLVNIFRCNVHAEFLDELLV